MTPSKLNRINELVTRRLGDLSREEIGLYKAWLETLFCIWKEQHSDSAPVQILGGLSQRNLEPEFAHACYFGNIFPQTPLALFFHLKTLGEPFEVAKLSSHSFCNATAILLDEQIKNEQLGYVDEAYEYLLTTDSEIKGGLIAINFHQDAIREIKQRAMRLPEIQRKGAYAKQQKADAKGRREIKNQIECIYQQLRKNGTRKLQKTIADEVYKSPHNTDSEGNKIYAEATILDLVKTISPNYKK